MRPSGQEKSLKFPVDFLADRENSDEKKGTFHHFKTVAGKGETWFLIAFSVLPWLAGTGLVIWAFQQKAWLLQQPPFVWILIFAGLSIPITLSLIPNTMAGLFMGFLLGFWALPGMVISFSLASVLGFFLGKRLDSGLRDTLFTIWPSWKKGFEKLKNRSFFLVVSFRLMPVPPFSIGNLLLSWFNLPFSTFFWASFWGMLPRMALVVWLGRNIHDLLFMIQNPGEIKELTWFSWLAFVGIALFWKWIWANISEKEKSGGKTESEA